MPRGARRLPDKCVERLLTADLILHAGDFVAAAVHDELCGYGPPVEAVYGNCDSADLCRRLPEQRIVEAGGARIAMIHDAGPGAGRLPRLRERFPDADAVVFGHTHAPAHEMAPGGFQIFNPGSPTERRRQPAHTMGMARVDDDGVVSFEIIVVG
jgi:uncharacterized protein